MSEWYKLVKGNGRNRRLKMIVCCCVYSYKTERVKRLAAETQCARIGAVVLSWLCQQFPSLTRKTPHSDQQHRNTSKMNVENHIDGAVMEIELHSIFRKPNIYSEPGT